jgi:hypothetical protein
MELLYKRSAVWLVATNLQLDASMLISTISPPVTPPAVLSKTASRIVPYVLGSNILLLPD